MVPGRAWGWCFPTGGCVWAVEWLITGPGSLESGFSPLVGGARFQGNWQQGWGERAVLVLSL